MMEFNCHDYWYSNNSFMISLLRTSPKSNCLPLFIYGKVFTLRSISPAFSLCLQNYVCYVCKSKSGKLWITIVCRHLPQSYPYMDTSIYIT